jgi:hypothetical protein
VANEVPFHRLNDLTKTPLCSWNIKHYSRNLFGLFQWQKMLKAFINRDFHLVLQAPMQMGYEGIQNLEPNLRTEITSTLEATLIRVVALLSDCGGVLMNSVDPDLILPSVATFLHEIPRLFKLFSEKKANVCRR